MTERSAAPRQIILRAVLAIGLAAGIAMSLFGLLGIWHETSAALMAISLVVIVMSVQARWRKAGLWLICGACAAGLIWLLTMDGIRTVQECAVGLLLHIMDIKPSLTLVSLPFACLSGGILALFCWAAVQESGVPLCLALTCASAIALWAGNANQYLPCLTPSLAVTLYCIGWAGHEGASRRRLLLSMCLIAAVICLLIPREGITVQPLREAADTIRQQIMDRFFFSESRNVFSLAREGYYPQGETQMGGPAEPSNHPVMTVETPKTVYLRAVVKDEYTGRYWRDTVAGRRYLWDSRQWRSERETIFDMLLPQNAQTEAVQNVRVTMTADGVSTLFVPQRIRQLAAGGNLVPYFNQSSELFVTRDVETGDNYACEAILLLPGDPSTESLIRQSLSSADTERDNEIAQIYTKLPSHLQEQVFSLTREAVGSAQAPYEKALAIMRWLKSNGSYTLDAPQQDPSKDFVTSFLLEGRKGYCVHFASAMTVMCRAAGLPARYVEGYLAEPDSTGKAYVTGMDGHAWTEVWLSGFGWLTFDATPSHEEHSGDEPPEAPPETPPQPEPDPEPEPDPQNQPETKTEQNQDGTGDKTNPDNPPEPDERSENWLWLLILLILMIILALALRIRYMLPAHEIRRQRDETGRWSVWMQAVSDALRVNGNRRPSSQSLAKWLSAIDESNAYPVRLAPLGECAGVVFYAHAQALPEETEMAKQACDSILNGMKRCQRIRFNLMRAFTRRHPFDGYDRRTGKAKKNHP